MFRSRTDVNHPGRRTSQTLQKPDVVFEASAQQPAAKRESTPEEDLTALFTHLRKNADPSGRS